MSSSEVSPVRKDNLGRLRPACRFGNAWGAACGSLPRSLAGCIHAGRWVLRQALGSLIAGPGVSVQTDSVASLTHQDAPRRSATRQPAPA